MSNKEDNMAKGIKELNITELFKQFCKERHAEDKGKNFDMLQEIYASTELFDLSYLPKTTPDMSSFSNGTHTYKGDTLDELIFTDTSFKDITLPFASQFVRLGRANQDEVCLMIREKEPFIITGTSYIKSSSFTLNTPFKINTELGELRTNLKGIYDYANMLRRMGVKEEIVKKAVEGVLEITLGQIMYVISNICNLPKHSVACDTPKHAEYYTRKHGSTIKTFKPVYYVLDKKEEKEKRSYNRIKPLGNLAFDHSFKVRSHWRKINENSLGMDRYGVRRIKGMTFIKEYVKGEGDLVKKIRIVK